MRDHLPIHVVVWFVVISTASVRLGANPPELEIHRVGDSVAVSWSTNDWTFALQSSTNACNAASWVNVEGAVKTESNRLVMTIAIAEADVLVFRLRQPSGLVAIDAQTVNLQNENYAADRTVLIRSQLGILAANPNTGAVPSPGLINFVQNVSYAGNPAQFHILPWEAYGTSPGIFLIPRPTSSP